MRRRSGSYSEQRAKPDRVTQLSLSAAEGVASFLYTLIVPGVAISAGALTDQLAMFELSAGRIMAAALGTGLAMAALIFALQAASEHVPRSKYRESVRVFRGPLSKVFSKCGGMCARFTGISFASLFPTRSEDGGPVVYAPLFPCGHVSPVVTLSVAMCGGITWSLALCHVTAQTLGALLAMPMLVLMLPVAQSANMGAPQLLTDDSVAQGFTLELVLTATLVFFTLQMLLRPPHSFARAAYKNGARPLSQHAAPVIVGCAYGAATLIAMPVTGAVFNPLRAFAPALFANYWSNQWVYWAGPVAGGMVGTLLHVASSVLGKDRGQQEAEAEEPDSSDSE